MDWLWNALKSAAGAVGDLFGGWGSIGSLIGAGADLWNVGQQQGARKDMMKMQRAAWAREDTAVQRRAADMEAAGLSKYLSLGSPASSSSPVSLPIPQMGTNALTGAISEMQMMKIKADVENVKVKTLSDLHNLQIAQRLGVPTNANVGERTAKEFRDLIEKPVGERAREAGSFFYRTKEGVAQKFAEVKALMKDTLYDLKRLKVAPVKSAIDWFNRPVYDR